MRPMRFTLTALTLAGLLLGLPMLTTAEEAAGNNYEVVNNWPQLRGTRAPRYGKAQVSAVAADAEGNVYVFQRATRAVVVFNREGRYLRSWGKGMFSTPHGCKVGPDGNVWLTDLDRHQVMKFTPEGKLLAAYGVAWKSGTDSRRFNEPADLAFGPNGDIYVADGYGNSRVVQLAPDGTFIRAWGKFGTGIGEFNLVHSIAVDGEGRVYVGDRENRRVQVFTAEGEYITQWRHFQRPFSLWVTPEQKLLVGDGTGNTFSLCTLDGQLLRTYRPSYIRTTHMVTMDNEGCVYVADLDGRKVQKFNPL